MKIAQIVSSFYPTVGGIERVVQFLSEELVALGHNVTVITSDIGRSGEKLRRQETLGRILVERVHSIHIFKGLKVPLAKPKLRGYDVLHIHSQGSLFNLFIGLTEKMSEKTPCVLHVMAIDALHDHPSNFVRTIGPLYDRLTLKIALHLADVVLTKSKRDLELLERRYDITGSLIPDAVPDYYFKKVNSEKFREKYNITDDNVVLFIGRLHSSKGPQILLKSTPVVLEFLPSTSFVFIGPDNGMYTYLRKEARRLGVSHKVKFLNVVSERDKLSALRTCSVLVLPSISSNVEVYSLVISEAWAQRKPVVASAVGEIPYRVKHGVNGLLVPPNDADALAEAIVQILSSPNLARYLGKNGRKEVRTWREIGLRMQEVYLEVAHSRKN